jgi:hypothetical protein
MTQTTAPTDSLAFGNACDRIMQQDYGINLNDAGYDAAEFVERFGDAGSPEEAVSEWAVKYDIDPIN